MQLEVFCKIAAARANLFMIKSAGDGKYIPHGMDRIQLYETVARLHGINPEGMNVGQLYRTVHSLPGFEQMSNSQRIKAFVNLVQNNAGPTAFTLQGTGPTVQYGARVLPTKPMLALPAPPVEGMVAPSTPAVVAPLVPRGAPPVSSGAVPAIFGNTPPGGFNIPADHPTLVAARERLAAIPTSNVAAPAANVAAPTTNAVALGQINASNAVPQPATITAQTPLRGTPIRASDIEKLREHAGKSYRLRLPGAEETMRTLNVEPNPAAANGRRLIVGQAPTQRVKLNLVPRQFPVRQLNETSNGVALRQIADGQINLRVQGGLPARGGRPIIAQPPAGPKRVRTVVPRYPETLSATPPTRVTPVPQPAPVAPTVPVVEPAPSRIPSVPAPTAAPAPVVEPPIAPSTPAPVAEPAAPVVEPAPKPAAPAAEPAAPIKPAAPSAAKATPTVKPPSTNAAALEQTAMNQARAMARRPMLRPALAGGKGAILAGLLGGLGGYFVGRNFQR